LIVERKRPFGITIIGIIFVINGIWFLIRAMFLVITFTFYNIGTPSDIVKLSIIVGYVLTSFAITSFIVARGLLKGKEWAWTLSIIFVIVSLFFYIIGIPLLVTEEHIEDIGPVDIANLIVGSIFIWYLFRPNIKEYFGR
jgi:hypothetical protein